MTLFSLSPRSGRESTVRFDPGRLGGRLALRCCRCSFPTFDPQRRVGEVWRVSYDDRAREAELWAAENGLRPGGGGRDADLPRRRRRPEHVLVSPPSSCSSRAAPAQARSTTTAASASSSTGTSTRSPRSCRRSTPIRRCRSSTPLWLVDEEGNHPGPYTLVSADDVAEGRWQVDPAVAETLGLDPDYALRVTLSTTRGRWRRAASTGSRSGPTTPCSAASGACARARGRGGDLLPHGRAPQLAAGRTGEGKPSR